MTYIKFDVDVRTWSTGGYDPEDEWSRDSTEGDVSVIGAVLVKEDSYDVLVMDEDKVVGDIVYLIWAQYSTGDSFGRDGGQYELLEVQSSRDVAETRKKYFEGVPSNDYSVPWSGYFENLDFVRVDAFVLT